MPRAPASREPLDRLGCRASLERAVLSEDIEHFEPEVDVRSNMFAWMGSTRPLDAFTFIFQETEWGPFIAHAYQYEVGRSTWIFETDPETFRRAGLEGLSERQSADRMAEIFGWFLQGHQLLTNRSMWRNFPMIRSKRWVKANMVLLGDAKATAHFSIGSGTKLAMEDAIALADAMHRAPTVDAALQQYEEGRREEVEKTQHAADVSLVWFEHVDRFWDFDPVQFAFGVMTRAKAITYDNLTLRAPDFVREVDKAFAKQVRAKGFDVDVEKPVAPMFQPLRLREMELTNRAVVSPMCMYSAKEGVPTDFHFVHYGSRAIGGAGLIFTEMTCVSRDARITPGCTGLWNDEQEAAWLRIVNFVHANSAAKILSSLGSWMTTRLPVTSNATGTPSAPINRMRRGMDSEARIPSSQSRPVPVVAPRGWCGGVRRGHLSTRP